MQKALCRRGLGLVSIALIATSLASCSSSSSSGGDYCSAIKSANANLKDMSSFANVNEASWTKIRTAASDIESKAPSDVKDDWKVLSDDFDAMDKAFKDAGLSMDDFSSIQSGKLPPGVDQAKLQQLGKTLQSVDIHRLTSATSAIKTEVKNTCHVELGTTASTPSP